MSNTKRDRLRNEWAEKYSSPGEFEESGQREAWTAGYDARQAEVDRLREALKAHDKWQMENGGEGYYCPPLISELCRITEEALEGE